MFILNPHLDIDGYEISRKVLGCCCPSFGGTLKRYISSIYYYPNDKYPLLNGQ